MGFDIDNLKANLCVFVLLEYQNSTPQLFENDEYNSVNCSRGNAICVKQYKTIHDK